MCQPKPGPRCSAHARDLLVRARDDFQAVQADETDEASAASARARLVRAAEEYDTTPEGQQTLQDLIDKPGQDPLLVAGLQARLERGRDRRQAALDAARVARQYTDRLANASEEEQQALVEAELIRDLTIDDYESAALSAAGSDNAEDAARSEFLKARADRARREYHVAYAAVASGVGTAWRETRLATPEARAQVKVAGQDTNLALWTGPSEGFPHGRVHRVREVADDGGVPVLVFGNGSRIRCAPEGWRPAGLPRNHQFLIVSPAAD